MCRLLHVLALVFAAGFFSVRSQGVTEKCTYAPMELVLVVDRSTSINVNDVYDYLFPNLFEPLAKSINLGEGEDQSRVGIVSWGVTTVADKQLSSTNSEDVMLNELAAIYGLSRSESGKLDFIRVESEKKYQSYENTGTYTHDALAMVKQDVAAKSKLRPDVPVVVLVFTDGKSKNFDQTAAAAESLRNHLKYIPNSKIVVVGIGKATVEELEAIAGTLENVIYVQTYANIELNLDTILDKVCVRPSCRNVITHTPLDYAYVSGTSDMFLAIDMNALNAKGTAVEADTPVRVGMYPSWPRSATTHSPFQPYMNGDLDGMYQEVHKTFTSIPTLNEAIEVALKDLTRSDYGQFLIITVTRPLSSMEFSEAQRLVTEAKGKSANMNVIIQGGGCASRSQLESLGEVMVANDSSEVRSRVHEVIASKYTKKEEVCE